VAKKTARKRTKKTTRKAPPRIARKKTAARATAARKRRKQPQPKKPGLVASTATAAKGMLAGAVRGVARRMPGRAGASAKEDAIELLEREHRRFEQLLKDGEETTERARKGRRELLATLTSELNAHELMEEKVLYPALQSHPQAREIVLEGYEEHHVADLIVAELQQVATNDEQWGAKFKVLKENIEHHIQEEEGEMFRTARGLFSREELLALADRMRALR